jgi:hypothetical protein
MWRSSKFKWKIGKMKHSKMKQRKRQNRPEFNRRLKGSIQNRKLSLTDRPQLSVPKPEGST